MKTFTTKAIALLAVLVMVMCSIPFATVSAAYENTHTNTGNMAADLVAVAATQVGYCEGSLAGTVAGSNNLQKYGQWYDNNVDYIGVTRAAWCAAFVSWCANQAGIPSSIITYHAYCPYGVNWFKNQGRFQYSASRGGSYVPKAGDIIYFAPSGSTVSSHIGIVRYVSGGYVYTTEGNTSGQNGEVNDGGGVFNKSYALSYSRIYGYGVPAYQDNSGHKITFESNGGSAVSSVNVKDGGTLSAPSNPAKLGFNFVGWYCNPELTDPYDFSSKVSYGFTLYAKWEEAYWGANTNIVPTNDGSLVCNPFTGGDGGTIWPYYNDDGSVTMYNGASNDSNWTWPSAYKPFSASFDSGNDGYLYVKYNSDAEFNATITVVDYNGNEKDIKLSDVYNDENGTSYTDMPAGYQEFVVNFGMYAYEQGVFSSGVSANLKYTKVTYYVIGPKDSFVRLYNLEFTNLSNVSIPDPFVHLYSDSISPAGGTGTVFYDGGYFKLTSESNAGAAVSIAVNETFDPSQFAYLLTDVNTNVDFNITMDVTSANGDGTIDFRKDYYNAFGDYAEPPSALPAGQWQPQLNLNGYFYYNGGTVTEATVKTVTISIAGAGTFEMNALQANRGVRTTYGVEGNFELSFSSDSSVASSVYTIENGYVYDITVGSNGMSITEFLTNFTTDGTTLVVARVDGTELTDPADTDANTIGTGMTIREYKDGYIVSTNTLVVMGDVNCDGASNTEDARMMLALALGTVESPSDAQMAAADYNSDSAVNTSDARALLKAIVAA